MKKITALWLCLACIAGVLLFHTSQEVQNRKRNTLRAEYNITQEQESIRILKAEWSYLNRPERLEKLVQDYLPTMHETRGQQVSNTDHMSDIMARYTFQIPSTLPRQKPMEVLNIANKAPATAPAKTAKPVTSAITNRPENTKFNDVLKQVQEIQ